MNTPMTAKLFTEYPEKNEQRWYERVTQVTRKRMEALYGDSTQALRDTHAKTQAALRAELDIFEVDEQGLKQAIANTTGLSAEQLAGVSLKQGILAQAKAYPVWLRFANGRTSVENDYESDTRSMSVKIMGLEGDRLPASHEHHTQDLIVQNAEIFFIKTIRNYFGFFNAVATAKLLALLWLITHPKQRNALKQITGRRPKSLLTERYWSGSASALGLPSSFDPEAPGTVPVTYPLAVKYAFTPVSPQPPHAPLPMTERSAADIERAKAASKDGVPDHYYRTEMAQALADPSAQYCWDFQIQIQTDGTQSIDDVTIPWPEHAAPFYTVGRLTIRHQQFESDAQQAFAENLQFSPWNGLAVHRPIGALNRLRKLVYPLVGNYRHRNRGIDYQEPTGTETF